MTTIMNVWVQLWETLVGVGWGPGIKNVCSWGLSQWCLLNVPWNGFKQFTSCKFPGLTKILSFPLLPFCFQIFQEEWDDCLHAFIHAQIPGFGGGINSKSLTCKIMSLTEARRISVFFKPTYKHFSLSSVSDGNEAMTFSSNNWKALDSFKVSLVFHP